MPLTHLRGLAHVVWLCFSASFLLFAAGCATPPQAPEARLVDESAEATLEDLAKEGLTPESAAAKSYLITLPKISKNEYLIWYPNKARKGRALSAYEERPDGTRKKYAFKVIDDNGDLIPIKGSKNPRKVILQAHHLDSSRKWEVSRLKFIKHNKNAFVPNIQFDALDSSGAKIRLLFLYPAEIRGKVTLKPLAD